MAGGIVGLLAAGTNDVEEESLFFGAAVERSMDVASVMYGTLLGGVLGLIAGTVIETDVWESVPPPWTVGVQWTHSEANLAFTVPLPNL